MTKTDNSRSVPRHIGIIMDGNRRWAKQNGQKTLHGHKQGAEQFLEVTDHAQKIGVDFVTVYAFSTENWSRTEEEVGYLMKLFVRVLTSQIDKLHKRGARLRIIGSYDNMKPSVIKVFKAAEEKTKNNTKGTLGICLNYGGQQELADATKKLIEAGVDSSEITPEVFASALYCPDIPPVDLIIRTSGEQRLSGFMLWRAAYSELYFTNKHWPEFGPADLDLAIDEFNNRQRRYGA